jgi:hypothetical protein
MMQRAVAEPPWNEQDCAETGSRASAQSSDRPIQTTQPAPAAPVKRATRSAISYGLLGFFLGAVFWHFVGFWDFVGQLMFKGGLSGTEIAQGPLPIKLKDRVSGSSAIAVVASAEACTMLRLDRATGETAAVPCEGEPLPLLGIRPAKREDLRITPTQRLIETTARGWGAVRIEQPGATVNQANAE